MIRINLLPTELAKRPGGGGSKLRLPKGGAWPYFLVLMLVYAGAVSAGYFFYDMGKKSEKRLSDLKKTLERKKKEVEEREAQFEEQNRASQEIEEKWQVAQALMSPDNRLFWSEKLNMLAKARMDLAVFMTKITLGEKIEEQETPESIKAKEEWKKQQGRPGAKKTPEPRAIKSPVINQTLTIDAIAYGNDSAQRLRQINAFEESLRELVWQRDSGTTARFVDFMDPQFIFLPHKIDTVGGVEVLRFGIMCRALPQKDRTSPLKGSGQRPGDAAAATKTGASKSGGKAK